VDEGNTKAKTALAAAALNFYDRVSCFTSDLEVDPITELFDRRIEIALIDPDDRKELQKNSDNIKSIEEKIKSLAKNNPKMQPLLNELEKAFWTLAATPMRGMYKQGFRDGCILVFSLFEKEKASNGGKPSVKVEELEKVI